MYSVEEAARKLGISGRRVRKLLAEGRIEGKKLGGTWVVLDLNYTRKRKLYRAMEPPRFLDEWLSPRLKGEEYYIDKGLQARRQNQLAHELFSRGVPLESLPSLLGISREWVEHKLGIPIEVSTEAKEVADKVMEYMRKAKGGKQ